jgi:hypothetical protein
MSRLLRRSFLLLNPRLELNYAVAMILARSMLKSKIFSNRLAYGPRQDLE